MGTGGVNHKEKVGSYEAGMGSGSMDAAEFEWHAGLPKPHLTRPELL